MNISALFVALIYRNLAFFGANLQILAYFVQTNAGERNFFFPFMLLR